MSTSKEKNWEIKDRMYHLTTLTTPLTLTIGTRHSALKPLLYFDEELGHQRELRYATNQKSVFVDEQKGVSTLGHVTFENGVLRVPKEKQNLQKLLSLYHPLRNKIYAEKNAIKEAEDDMSWLESELEAMNLCKSLEIDDLEAIMRVQIGSRVTEMSSKEIKRDALLFARKEPLNFLELASDDNVQLRNFGIKACEAKILALSKDQRTFKWASNGRKLFTVPFDEHPYSALAAWFKTDEGLEVYKAIDKKLK